MSDFNILNLLATRDEAKLTVQTGDEAAEIFVIDSQFHLVKRGIGKSIEFKLPCGLYSVKVRAGSDSQEKNVILADDKIVSFAPIDFASPAPLEGTRKTSLSHTAHAHVHSQQVHVHLGNGSCIYVFARDWTAELPPSELSLSSCHPAQGLTLRDMNGQVLVDLAAPLWPHDLSSEPWSACNVEVDPGIYRLCLSTPSGESLEQTVVASPEWQTQIFLLQRKCSREGERLADLPNSAMFLARVQDGLRTGMQDNSLSDSPDSRLSEMARQALATNRRVLSNDVIDRMLHNKFHDPMLGIYGAHLLLLDEGPDLDILRTVVTNLRNLLGTSHPDVEALALKLGEESNHIYDLPPMLRRSWGFVLNASVTQPRLVPEGSLTYKIAGRLWSGDPWLLWTEADKDGDWTNMLLGQVARLAESLGALAAPFNNLARDRPLLAPTAAAAEFSLAGYPDTLPPLGSLWSELDDQAITQWVQALGVPRGKLENLLNSIVSQH